MDKLPNGIRDNSEAMAETIENNVRRLIIDEMAVNPKYYDKMSQLLDALILERKREAMDYKEYLAKIVALTKKVSQPETEASYPSKINTPALRALFDNLEETRVMAVHEPTDAGEPAVDGREVKALALDRAIREVKKADWRGNKFKEREVRNAIKSEVGDNYGLVDRLLEIVKNQRDY
jgi:type I restriction enzyme, R subunit